MNRKALQKLARADRVMGRLIERVGPCRIDPEMDDHPHAPFVALVRAVAHQQLTGKAANTILGRLTALYPDLEFPGPAELLASSDEQLRGVGFSRAKVAALKDIAARTLDGTVPGGRAIRELEDEAIVERLTCIRGVGRWTVEMLLIFQLGRPDVLPVDDYGVKKGFMLTYRRRALPRARELAEFGERWRPFRSAAAWYLWRSIDLQRRADLRK